MSVGWAVPPLTPKPTCPASAGLSFAAEGGRVGPYLCAKCKTIGPARRYRHLTSPYIAPAVGGPKPFGNQSIQRRSLPKRERRLGVPDAGGFYGLHSAAGMRWAHEHDAPHSSGHTPWQPLGRLMSAQDMPEPDAELVALGEVQVHRRFDSGQSRAYKGPHYACRSAFHRALPAVTCLAPAVRLQLDS